MTKLIVDAGLTGQLSNLVQPSQFVPALDVTQISEEELERRRLEPDYSTAEVLAYLDSL